MSEEDVIQDPTVEASTSAEGAFVHQCIQDYEIAELTAIGHMDPASKEFRLVIVVVELLHRHLEINPNIGIDPGDGGYPQRFSGNERTGALVIQRWHLPVREAIRWYRNCLTGLVTVPGYKKGHKAQNTSVSLPQMSEDPPWPRCIVEERPFWNQQTNFWGNRPGGSRWHRLLPVAPVEITNGWLPADREAARRFLLDHIHLDLLSRSVLLGSCHLVLPNPLFASASLTGVGDGSGVQLDVTSYPGRSLDGLELTICNRLPWGVTSVIRQPITSRRTFVSLPEMTGELVHAITCRARGLLDVSAPGFILAAVQLNMSVVSEERRVEVPARSKAHGPEQFTVPVSGKATEILAGTPRPVGARSRLYEDYFREKALEANTEFEMKWFDGGVAGQQELRRIIGQGLSQVEIVDPYFGPDDLLPFAVATRRRDLPVRILTSAYFCQMSGAQEMEEGGRFLRALERVRKQDPGINITVRVMLGDKSPIHDRFLIVDGIVWWLGSSFNEFGARGTLLIRLPTPPTGLLASSVLSIRDDIFESMWTKRYGVESLEQFVERRAQARRPLSWTDRIQRTVKRCARAVRDVQEIWRA
jgi:hypothetical protein